MKHLSLLLALFLSLAAFAQGSKPSTAQMKLDLVGQSFVDPNPQSYFGPESKCTVGRGEVRGISVVKENISDDKYVAQVIIHLNKKGMLVDVLALVQYRRQAEGWQFGRVRARSITFPTQEDRSDAIELSEDRDFIPMMMARSSARDTLMVGFEMVQNSETKRFVMILAPRESKPATMMIPDDIKVEFAYVYDADYDLLESFYKPEEDELLAKRVTYEGIFDPERGSYGSFCLQLLPSESACDALLFINGYLYDLKRSFYSDRSLCFSEITLDDESRYIESHLSISIDIPEGEDFSTVPVLSCNILYSDGFDAILYRPDLIK